MKETYTYRGGIILDPALCAGCGKCYEVCPMDVFGYDREGQTVEVVYPEDCWYCGACIYDCPVEGALRMEFPLAVL